MNLKKIITDNYNRFLGAVEFSGACAFLDYAYNYVGGRNADLGEIMAISLIYVAGAVDGLARIDINQSALTSVLTRDKEEFQLPLESQKYLACSSELEQKTK